MASSKSLLFYYPTLLSMKNHLFSVFLSLLVGKMSIKSRFPENLSSLNLQNYTDFTTKHALRLILISFKHKPDFKRAITHSQRKISSNVEFSPFGNQISRITKGDFGREEKGAKRETRHRGFFIMKTLKI